MSRKYITPFLRFLRKNCGRPWLEVEAEVTSAVDGRTWRSHALLELLGDLVSLCQGCGAHAYHRFFVQDGILLEGRSRAFRRARRAAARAALAEEDPEPEVRVDLHTRYRRRDGIWYEVRLRHCSEAGTRTVYDAWTGSAATDPWSLADGVVRPGPGAYEGSLYCWSKRQLGRKELRRAGLVNRPVR